MALCAMRWFMKQKPNYTADEYRILIAACVDINELRLIKEQFKEDREERRLDLFDSLDIHNQLIHRLLSLQLLGED